MDQPLIHGLSPWDYAVIVFYFLSVVSGCFALTPS